MFLLYIKRNHRETLSTLHQGRRRQVLCQYMQILDIHLIICTVIQFRQRQKRKVSLIRFIQQNIIHLIEILAQSLLIAHRFIIHFRLHHLLRILFVLILRFLQLIQCMFSSKRPRYNLTLPLHCLAVLIHPSRQHQMLYLRHISLQPQFLQYITKLLLFLQIRPFLVLGIPFVLRYQQQNPNLRFCFPHFIDTQNMSKLQHQLRKHKIKVILFVRRFCVFYIGHIESIILRQYPYIDPFIIRVIRQRHFFAFLELKLVFVSVHNVSRRKHRTYKFLFFLFFVFIEFRLDGR
mmetsp:Transcript_2821/g.4639  ORF Transcript_2821/g.4639 Transcript_2821/m.4639 type:complete len:291 (-) Transcript_2821:402-1274(-)